jgi:glycosyltransferase involved in cell wall biosynthesis
LREYDIIISDSSAWAKGVITKPEQLHISYVHTPPRFLYKYTSETTSRNKWYFKPFVALIDSYLRTWDYEAAQRPDFLLTNSCETQRRIQKFYNRESRVIYPPVELANKPYTKDNDNLRAPFYLSVGRLAAYKNIDLIIQGFNLTGIPLVIIGAGKEEERLKKMAKDNVTFLGPVSDEETHKKMDECLGFIFPVVDEEFGIAAVEAMSHGKPVLAHKSGGPLEIIHDGVDGMFFDKADIETFVKSLKEFDSKVRKGTYNSETIKEHAQPFNKARFKNEFSAFVNKKWDEKNHKS